MLWIIGVMLAIVLMVALLFAAMHRLSRASRGGVEAAPGEFRRRGGPPFESIARKR
jgi:hypothetical protein